MAMRVGLPQLIRVNWGKGLSISRSLSLRSTASSSATLKRTQKFWNRTVTLFPHLIQGGLTVGTVGFGSPHFAAPKHRENALVLSLQNGCNLIELSEAWSRDDPRIVGEEGFLDQFLYGSWESAELDRIFTEASLKDNSISRLLDDSAHVDDNILNLSREELVYMGRCSLSSLTANEKEDRYDVKAAVAQLCEYHFVDEFDFIMIDISEVPCDKSFEKVIQGAMSSLEELCEDGTMIAYGFSLNSDHITFQLNALRNIHKAQNANYPRFSVLGIPASPFAHIPPLDIVKQYKGFENVHIFGEKVTHHRSQSSQPVRYVNAYPTPIETSNENRSGERIAKALNRAIFLEKEYTSRFIDGEYSKQVKSKNNRAVEASPGVFDMGDENSKEEELTYPLPYLPRHEDVSWGQLLAMHHDSQIESPDQWEAAKHRMIVPLLDQALHELSLHKPTKDWAVLYKVTCRELFSAFDEEHNYRRHHMSQKLSEHMDTHVTHFSKPFGPRGTAKLSLEARCCCLAFSKGIDIVMTEDWNDGALFNYITPANIPFTKEATKLTHLGPLLK